MLTAAVLAALLFWLSCSSDKSATAPSPSLPATFVPASPLDIALTFVSFNMDVGFEPESMVTQNLTDPWVVFTQGKSLYSQLIASRPRERMRALADSLSRLKPDVVCLQEVLYLENRIDSQSFDFLNLLLAGIDLNGGPAYGVVRQTLNPLTIRVAVTDSLGRDSVDIFFEEGNAILYKTGTLSLQAADSITYNFGIKDLKYLDNTTISIRRGALYAALATGNSTVIKVFNTHFEVEGIPFTGMSQAIELDDNFSRRWGLGAEAVVLLGDYNDPPSGARVQLFVGENFTDTYHGGDLTCCYSPTDIAKTPDRRIDYCLARGIVKIDTAGVWLNGTFRADGSDCRLSDHAASLTRLTFH
jgi:endonuclease/exonuclease/phosphatase family metal-dependent hydrolase